MRIPSSVVALLVSVLVAVVLAAPGNAEPDTAGVLAPAQADLEAELGKPAVLDVTTLTSSDGWAFLWADITGLDGQPVDYSDTPFAEAAEHGAVSKRYVGLFRFDGTQWTLVDSRVGPTDVAWENWDHEYGAPPEIFVTS